MKSIAFMTMSRMSCTILFNVFWSYEFTIILLNLKNIKLFFVKRNGWKPELG